MLSTFCFTINLGLALVWLDWRSFLTFSSLFSLMEWSMDFFVASLKVDDGTFDRLAPMDRPLIGHRRCLEAGPCFL